MSTDTESPLPNNTSSNTSTSTLSGADDNNEYTIATTSDSCNNNNMMERLRILKERRYKAKKDNLAQVVKYLMVFIIRITIPSS